MGNRLNEAKDDLISRTAERAEQSRLAAAGPGQAARFVGDYYRHAAAEDLIDRDPIDLLGAAASHRALAEQRPDGTAVVRAFTPTVDEHGWSTGHTVVDVVTDDMPFLVDTVTTELTRQGRAIHLLLHPQLAVERDVEGHLVTVGGASAQGCQESWIHVEIDRETDFDDLRAIEKGLRRVLRDVRESVEDWPRMRHAALTLADDLASDPPVGPASQEIADAEEFLRWLADDHFTFLGYRDYALESTDDGDLLRPLTGTGLGILRGDRTVSESFAKLPVEVRAKAREPHLLVLTKANSRSTVHRPAYLDYIGVKTFDAAGQVTGEQRFLGLLSNSAYNESVLRVPVLRRKARSVLQASGFAPGSHSSKDLLQILETYPRDALFQAKPEELLQIATAVMHLQERRQLRLFVRRDDYGRYLSCLIYLPRDRYTTQVRLAMQEILLEATGGESVDHTVRVGESVLARLHFVIRMSAGQILPELDVEDLEEKLTAATRTWNDEFVEALDEQLGEEEGARLRRRFASAFTEAFKEDFAARGAVGDVRRLEGLAVEDGLAMNLYQPIGAQLHERRFKVYRSGSPISLTEVLPILADLGVDVVDEWPYEITPAGSPVLFLYDFGLRWSGEMLGDPEETKASFQEAFEAVWRGYADSDGFNALVLKAGLSWQEVCVLRAYARYLRQIGTTYSLQYLEECLVAHPELSRCLVELFRIRFDPDRTFDAGQSRQEAADVCRQRILAGLDDVASLDQDRIVRLFLALVTATLRTNCFQDVEGGGVREYRSFKIDPRAVPELPAPRPAAEIWVHSPAVEGVHLRFGPVARGGLRWSDRKEDFRTEILGLVKAQAVKNAVIVPVGAKGGFVAKRLPDPSVAGRDAWLAAGIEAYTTFIRGMLDITDNRLHDGTVVPPAQVVRHDGDDPYLVVAADKGTATFSDIANGISAEYGFWLGDAFASGGSAGYDHKVMGITARGAWESVKRHFRELGRDTQAQDVTVVGVGDMSGDVFGNGMLLSPHIRLVAAFDHRHVFLDPSPDAAASFAERSRLFALPRSSWGDYDAALISPGGGVFPRTAKAVPISEEVRHSLGLPDDVTSLTPTELLRAVLLAPVDLLWNGGIGTYVKSAAESHADVGDKANDNIRVDGGQLRALVVGEGGNLGFTQRGRIEYSLTGGRINTDAIDNSAGVDTSDHEVNIKILLDHIVATGDLTEKQRDETLSAMTDDVAGLVLRTNYEQNVALATAVANAPGLLHVHASYLRSLESRGLLDRGLEALPTDKEIAARAADSKGLTQPELAVLLAYTKNTLFDELVGTSLPDDVALQRELLAYFPPLVREKFGSRVGAHPLRREIITTRIVNAMVNTGGITFVYRLAMETGASAEDLARAHAVAAAVFDLPEIEAAIEALDTVVDAGVQTRMRTEVKTLVERATRWLVVNRRPPIDVAWQVEYFDAPVASVVRALPELLVGTDAQDFEVRRASFVAQGVPEELATRIAVLPRAYSAMHIVENAVSTGTEVLEVARVSSALSDELGLGQLLDRIVALPRKDRWQAMARAALRDDLHGLQATLVAQVVATTEESLDAAARVQQWVAADAVVVGRSSATLEEIISDDVTDLARLSVALRVVRALVRQVPSAT